MIGTVIEVPHGAHADATVGRGDPWVHAEEEPVALACEIEELEVVDEVAGIEEAAVAVGGVAPARVVVEGVFELDVPCFDGGALGWGDFVAAGVVEVDEAIGLAGDVVAGLRGVVGGRLEDTVRTGGAEELRRGGSLGAGKPLMGVASMRLKEWSQPPDEPSGESGSKSSRELSRLTSSTSA